RDEQLAGEGAERAHRHDAADAADGRGGDERAEHADDGRRGNGGAGDTAEHTTHSRATEAADQRADSGTEGDGAAQSAPRRLLTVVLALPPRLVLVRQRDRLVDRVRGIELRGQRGGAIGDLGGDRELEIVDPEG